MEHDVAPLTIACPHCGGEIKAAAKVCKHCKRPTEQPPTSGFAPAQAAQAVIAPGARPAVIASLRSFVLKRGLLRAEQFDAEHAKSNSADAAVFLGHLAAAGYITAMQIEGLRDAFREDQEAQGARLLQAATTRGLLSPAKVQEAVAGFQQVAFTMPMPEYLVAEGYLTRVQADEYDAPTSPIGALAAAQRLCARTTAALTSVQVARWAVIAGGVLMATFLLPRSYRQYDGMVWSWNLLNVSGEVWITTTFPLFAGFLLLLAGLIVRPPSGWLIAACLFTGGVPALMSALRTDVNGFTDIGVALREASIQIATLLCLEAVRTGKVLHLPWARRLMFANAGIVALALCASTAWPPIRGDLAFPAMMIRVESLALLGFVWLAVNTARRRPPIGWLALAVGVIGLGGNILFNLAIVLGDEENSFLALSMANVSLTIIQVTERMVGIAGLGMLVLGRSWSSPEGGLMITFSEDGR